MARRNPPRKVTYFEPVAPRLARNTVIESTFEVGRRFRCTMRVDCGRLDPDTVIRPAGGEWQAPHAVAARRRRARRLARRPQRDLPACRADDRCAARGRRRISRQRENPGWGAGVSTDRRSGSTANAQRGLRYPKWLRSVACSFCSRSRVDAGEDVRVEPACFDRTSLIVVRVRCGE
jgi:hypothetical protein